MAIWPVEIKGTHTPGFLENYGMEHFKGLSSCGSALIVHDHHTSLVDPLFLLLQTLPVVGPMPLQPPLTYVVNNLINVPVDKSNEMKWVSPAGNANAACA